MRKRWGKAERKGRGAKERKMRKMRWAGIIWNYESAAKFKKRSRDLK